MIWIFFFEKKMQKCLPSRKPILNFSHSPCIGGACTIPRDRHGVEYWEQQYNWQWELLQGDGAPTKGLIS